VSPSQVPLGATSIIISGSDSGRIKPPGRGQGIPTYYVVTDGNGSFSYTPGGRRHPESVQCICREVQGPQSGDSGISPLHGVPHEPVPIASSRHGVQPARQNSGRAATVALLLVRTRLTRPSRPAESQRPTEAGEGEACAPLLSCTDGWWCWNRPGTTKLSQGNSPLGHSP
jgi:hypothetical protein